jgi:hypothetical protein
MADAPAPQEAVLGSGAGGPLSVPTPWIIGSGYIAYPFGGIVVGNPTGGAKGVGSVNAQSYYINGTLVDLTKYVLWTGGAMQGVLTLYQDPVNPLDAVTKRYADNQITVISGNFSNYLPIAGGTLTGPLVLAADPSANLQASTKQYVDNKLAGLIGIPDAPSDGTVYARQNGNWVNAQAIDMGTF